MSVPYWLSEQTQVALESEKPACVTCRFGVLSDRQYTGFECRRRPPIMVKHKSSCAEWSAPGWPDVKAGDWCGEYDEAPHP